MPIKDQALTVTFTVWNTDGNAPRTGDADNLTMRVIADGTAAAATNSPSEEENGEYSLLLTADEMDADFVTVEGSSSTDDTVVFPLHIPTLSLADVATYLWETHGTRALTDKANFALAAAYDAAKSAAPAATALSTAQWTAALAGYIANLNVGGNVASQADVQGITQACRVRVLPAPQMERPDSGSTPYRVWIYAYNEQHKAEDLDCNPTVTAENNASVDRSANLDAVTKQAASTGIYYVDYNVASDHAIEGIVFKADATEGGVTTEYSAASIVVDTTAVDFTAADRVKLEAINGKLPGGDIADADVCTEARLARLDAKVSSRNAVAPLNAAQTGVAVLDVAQADHKIANTVGESISNAGSGATPATIAKAVWEYTGDIGVALLLALKNAFWTRSKRTLTRAVNAASVSEAGLTMTVEIEHDPYDQVSGKLKLDQNTTPKLTFTAQVDAAEVDLTAYTITLRSSEANGDELYTVEHASFNLDDIATGTFWCRLTAANMATALDDGRLEIRLATTSLSERPLKWDLIVVASDLS